MMKEFRIGKTYGDLGYMWKGIIMQFRFSRLRKEKVCQYCNQKIEKGEVAYVDMYCEGVWNRWHYHVECISKDQACFIYVDNHLKFGEPFRVVDRKGNILKEVHPDKKELNEIIREFFEIYREKIENLQSDEIAYRLLRYIEHYKDYEDYDVVEDGNTIYIYDNQDKIIKTIPLQEIFVRR